MTKETSKSVVAAAASAGIFRPNSFQEQFLNSAAVWLALMGYWALVDLLIAHFPPSGRAVQPDSGLVHALFTLAGLAAIACMHRTGFPAAWDARIPATRRLLLPFLIGCSVGLLAIGIEELSGAAKILEARMGTPFTVAFPGSLLVYSAAAITMETLFLIVPVPVLLWLISSVLLRGRGQVPTFWVLAVLSSAAEPLLQGTSLMRVAQGAIGPGVFAMYFAESFAHNFAAAALLRRYGLLAAVLVRLGHYLIWHILYGNFFFDA